MREGKNDLVKKIESLEEFLRIIQNYKPAHDETTVYRGQRDIAWKLLPSIARDSVFNDEAICKTLDDNSAERNLFCFFAIILLP